MIYAYETDGMGHYNLMDDANVPSLLSIAYLGYVDADDPLYANTRRFVLSAHNPYYHEGTYARGVGNPHTPDVYIWPISLCMQGLTSNDVGEMDALIDMPERTDAGTEYMHEGVLTPTILNSLPDLGLPGPIRSLASLCSSGSMPPDRKAESDDR